MTKLESRLKALSFNNSELEFKYHQLEIIVQNLCAHLRVVPMYFPHFSRHDESHSRNLLRYIGMLLGDKQIESFSASDLMLLVLACFSHDIGMSLQYEKIHEIMQGTELLSKLTTYTASQQEDLAMAAERLLILQSKIEESDDGTRGDNSVLQDAITSGYDVLDIYKDVLQVIETEFRKNHPKRSAEIIKSDGKINDLLGTRLTNLLASICEAHGEAISGIMSLPQVNVGLFDDYVHPRFLAAMLSIGDLLDMDTDRFDEIYIDASTRMPKLSEIHREKHQSITDFLVKDGIVEICADCSNMDSYRALRDWIDWLKKACEFTSVHWRMIAPEGFDNAPYVNKADILYKGGTKWLKFSDTKFNISNEHALELLKGSGIYRSKFVFLREVIQNAMDATVQQIYSDLVAEHGKITEEQCLEYLTVAKEKGKEEGDISETSENDSEEVITDAALDIDKYAITGRIYIDDTIVDTNAESKADNPKVIFELSDHGTGISTDDISRIAGIKGKSSKAKDKISTMPRWLQPSGVFSIGLQSIFLVADSFEVITKTTDEKAKKIVFEETKNGRGYITVSDYDAAMPQGTTIKVIINENKISQADLSVNDYYYETVPKYRLIYKALATERYNLVEEKAPVFRVRQQFCDYIPLTITGQVPIKYSEPDENDKPLKLVQYKSIFREVPCNCTNHTKVSVSKGLIDYCTFDAKNACMFHGCVELSENDKHTYGKDGLKPIYKYGKAIFYRNVFVKDGFGELDNHRKGRLLSLVDYNINLMSDKADKILNLGRNDIRETYRKDLYDLVEIEIEKMMTAVIDYLMSDECELSTVGDIVFILYQISREIDYKSDDIWKKYNDILTKIKIDSYFPVILTDIKESGEKAEDAVTNSITFSIEDLQKKEICFLAPMENRYNNIPDSCFEELDKTGEYYQLHPKNASMHIVDHKLEKEFIAILDGKKYHAYITTPFMNKKSEVVELDDFLKYDEIFNVVCGTLRCVHASSSEYEILCTPVFSSKIAQFGPYSDFLVEMEMDEAIKNKLSEELLRMGFIKDCEKRYLKEIAASKKYKEHIAYICTYQKFLGASVSKQEVEVRYRDFVAGMLKLLENEEMADYVHTSNLDAMKDALWRSNPISFHDADYSYYIAL